MSATTAKDASELVNELLGPVNENLIRAPMTAKEQRTVGLIRRMTILDEPHAIEFARVFAWEISTSPGGAEGLLRKRLPHLLVRP